jgi:general secretion pathway protein E
LVKESDLAKAYSRVLGVPIVKPNSYPNAPLFPDKVPVSFLRENRTVLLGFDGDTLLLALVDPLDRFVPSVVSARLGCAVRIEVAVPIELDAALDRLYPPPVAASVASVTSFEFQAGTMLEQDIERLRDMASEAPVIRLVNEIIQRAVETRASDIHLEAYSTDVCIRYRYDGLLFLEKRRPVAEGPAIISRVKIMAKLDIAERRLPQDGRIQMSVRGTEIDFRVSTVPSANGESIVLRILDRSALTLDYDTLGLDMNLVQAFRQALLRPYGAILVTGPTGSGKTTTLYTGLASLVDTNRNIVSIEDPVEYHLDGVRQIQTQAAIGLTFSGILRSVLRQDPDIIMVGEMRDTETARTAFQAALTGHLVLSTLHTNSAAGAITRLRDMGVEAYLTADLLVGVVAQRLVRLLCNHCKREADDVEFILHRSGVGLPPSSYKTPLLWTAVGCPSCRNTGYHGRRAIGEFLEPSRSVRELIFSNAEEHSINEQAVQDGMTTMFRSGMELAFNGVTTVEEIVRHVRRDDQWW